MAAIQINEKQFQQMLQEEKPLLVDFWAPWCGYCRRIGPAYEKIAQQYGQSLNVAKVNIDEEVLLAERERIDVIPTLVLYRGGEVLGSIVAPGSKADIDSFLRQNLGA